MFFHSGASEGINTIFKGIGFNFFIEKKRATFFFATTDHASVVEQQKNLETLGHTVCFFSVDKNGVFNQEKLVQQIQSENDKGAEVFLNFTYVNNETGVVWPLAWALELKKKVKVFIHVDAVQSVGKIPHWEELSLGLDAYTYSGHKFGAMKGVGFSFISRDCKFEPLICGGTQQDGFRAGTENALGVYSLKLALLEMKENFKPDELLRIKKKIEDEILNLIDKKGEIVARSSPFRNLNTFFLILYGKKAEFLSAKFDMMGVDLSTGSACSSGVIKENRILLEMNYSKEDSRAALRFSFSPFLNEKEGKAALEKIKLILEEILD